MIRILEVSTTLIETKKLDQINIARTLIKEGKMIRKLKKKKSGEFYNVKISLYSLLKLNFSGRTWREQDVKIDTRGDNNRWDRRNGMQKAEDEEEDWSRPLPRDERVER